MLVSQGASLLQFQLLLEETMNRLFPPLSGTLRAAKLSERVVSMPDWVMV